MAQKKYVVRDGFVVLLSVPRTDGSASERRYEGGEEVTLDDDQAAAHAHKIEFASQKDRDAAAAAEKDAAVHKLASSTAPDFIGTLAAAIAQANAAAVKTADAPAA